MSGTARVESPLQGTVLTVPEPGATVRRGATLVILESMKMEHAVPAPCDGAVLSVAVAVGDPVAPGDLLVEVGPLPAGSSAAPAGTGADEPAGAGAAEAGGTVAGGEGAGTGVRPELAALYERRAHLADAARPDAVARRHAQGHRTARENVADLCDPGTFEEYGGLVVAAQRARRDLHELQRRTVADGLVAGIGQVNGHRFAPEAARCAVLSYDYTVLAGTQGQMNHRKKDRLFALVERLRLPVVLFAEGGGGRPGDTDHAVVTGLDTLAFALFAGLSGRVPLVGVVCGRCFAGNAVLAGCCDVLVATADSSIGMGGPAMIEGGGLGVYAPDDVGPLSMQVPNGVVDVVAADDAEAVAVARQYLSYFQGPLATWECADQEALRTAVPADRRRAYDVRTVLHLLCDTGSVLELRAGFAPGMVTALARVEGRPVGVVANNPLHLAGAVDAAGADKAARFLQLCDAFDLPVVLLCDTPGFMVGPEAERAALVRHAGRMFVAGAALTVPVMTVVLRKGYGLGAQAMAAGSFRAPLFTVAWPTGELGGMGLEGAVRLGFRRELDAAEDPVERQRLFERLVARAYEHGRALNVAEYFEIDDVIDPAETRARIVHALRAAPPVLGWAARTSPKRPFVDTW